MAYRRRSVSQPPRQQQPQPVGPIRAAGHRQRETPRIARDRIGRNRFREQVASQIGHVASQAHFHPLRVVDPRIVAETIGRLDAIELRAPWDCGASRHLPRRRAGSRIHRRTNLPSGSRARSRRSRDKAVRRTSRAGPDAGRRYLRRAQDWQLGEFEGTFAEGIQRSILMAINAIPDCLERIDKLQFSAGHAFGKILGVIMHGHVEQVV